MRFSSTLLALSFSNRGTSSGSLVDRKAEKTWLASAFCEMGVSREATVARLKRRWVASMDVSDAGAAAAGGAAPAAWAWAMWMNPDPIAAKVAAAQRRALRQIVTRVPV